MSSALSTGLVGFAICGLIVSLYTVNRLTARSGQIPPAVDVAVLNELFDRLERLTERLAKLTRQIRTTAKKTQK